MENPILQKNHRNLLSRLGMLREEIQGRLLWAFSQKIEDFPQRRNPNSSKYKDTVGSRDKGLDLRRSRLPDFELGVKVKVQTRT
jgi:hypothetical protein